MCIESKKPFVPPSSDHPPSNRRYRIWELSRKFHCSIIGTCLTLEELSYLCRKAEGGRQVVMQDYERHVACVRFSEENSFIAKRINKLLDRKYRHSIVALSKLNGVSAMIRYWKAALDSGEVAGAYWALLSDPRAPDELVSEAYGQVHMLSHLAGAEVRVNMQELHALQRERIQSNKAFSAYKKTMADKLKDSEKNRLTLEQRVVQNQHYQARCAELEQALEQSQLNSRLLELQAELGRQQQALQEAFEENNQLQRTQTQLTQRAEKAEALSCRLGQQLTEATQALEAVEARLADWLDHSIDRKASWQQQSETDLCGRCILYVGGRNRQCARFKALVERCNGEFIHHDGGKEDSRLQLGNTLSRADAVICPLDCISHDALKKAKQFCERNARPFVMLPRATLAAFSKGLRQIDGRAANDPSQAFTAKQSRGVTVL